MLKNKLCWWVVCLVIVLASPVIAAPSRSQQGKQQQDALGKTQSAATQTMRVNKNEVWKDLGNGWEEMQLETGISVNLKGPSTYNYISNVFWCEKNIILKTFERNYTPKTKQETIRYYLLDINKKSATEIRIFSILK
jgi:hypothetical protein